MTGFIVWKKNVSVNVMLKSELLFTVSNRRYEHRVRPPSSSEESLQSEWRLNQTDTQALRALEKTACSVSQQQAS
jgi:hypothetical protein